MIYLSYVMSLDGKIGDIKRGFYNFSSRKDREKLFFLRAMADVVVVGANTVRKEDPPFEVKKEYLKLRRELGKRDSLDVAIVSNSMNLDSKLRVFSEDGKKVFIFTTNSEEKIYGKNVEVVRFSEINGSKIADFLKGEGYSDILVEGGGEVNSLFLRDGLVDKIYTTISPIVLGGRENPTPCGGDFFEMFQEFQLVNVKRVINEVFLEYEKVKLI